jgi:hypothetical protein
MAGQAHAIALPAGLHPYDLQLSPFDGDELLVAAAENYGP